MNKRVALTALLAGFFATILAAASRPNIVLIYADDLGYGDVGCYGAQRVKTPNIDRLATQGLRFTDAHSPSATCTPSRYALLTGQYAWRKKGTGVLPGDAKLIIDPDRMTLASMLRDGGYKSAAIGKWHLGLGLEEIDWNHDIKPGPLELGFSTCFIMPATGDRVPCVYIRDHRIAGLDPNDPLSVSFTNKVGNEPTGREHPELLRLKPSHGHDMTIVNGISRIGYMAGAKAARWTDENIADVLTREAVRFIDQNKDGPFFLYFATHDIHVPRVPHPRFVGKTEMGARGDVIVELDWSVGEIMAALERNHLETNTLLIVSSDNGPVVDDGYRDEAFEKLGDHRPAGPYRGGKYSIFEGGTRVPMIVRWPGRVQPGTSAALVCHIDFLASFAALTGQDVPANAAPDSLNMLPALLGEDRKGRESLVEHAGSLGMRKGEWKMIEPGKGNRFNRDTRTELGNAPAPQLYHVSGDAGETNNVAAEHPEIVQELTGLLREIRTAGRSR